MIYDFALEPELVATWHDRRVAYPFLSHMGLGQRRVHCAYPSAAWKKLVMNAFRASISDEKSPQGQNARKHMEVLLQHLAETGTRRSGRLQEGETWLKAAIREHAEFPFGGIVVRSFAGMHSEVIAADRIGAEDCPAWTPAAPPVVRQPQELANALAPLLRCATHVRFVDPYFDPEVREFFEPMKEYLLVAQKRRSVYELRVQIHFAIRRDEVERLSSIRGRLITEVELAKERVAACEDRLRPLLHSRVSVRAFAWGQRSGGAKMHNRYVLTELGGVAVQTGLDQSPRSGRETDDLTVLSKEQHEARWSQYREESITYPLLADRVFTGSASQTGEMGG